MHGKEHTRTVHEIGQQDTGPNSLCIDICQQAIIDEVPSERIWDNRDDPLGLAIGWVGDVRGEGVQCLDSALGSALVGGARTTRSHL